VEKILWQSLATYPNLPSLALWRAIEIKILSKIKITPPVLDIGCGDGSFAKLIYKNRIFEVGCDIIKEYANCAKKKGIYSHISVNDACKISFKNASFSTVFSNCVFEHIQNYQEALEEVYRVLKPGGSFITTVPSEKFHEYLYYYNFYIRKGKKDKAEKYLSDLDKAIEHFYYKSPEEWKTLLLKIGFVSIKTHYYIPKETEQVWNRIDNFYNKKRIANYSLRKIMTMRKLQFIAKTMIPFSMIYLSKYYNKTLKPGEKGGALLIIAIK